MGEDGIFDAEDPQTHWPGVDVRDRVVLDLGAGDFGRMEQNDYPSTGDWWLQQGAKHVVVVDREAKDLAHYEGRECFTVVCRSIDGPDEIVDLLLDHVPDVVKADIEGAERHFLSIEPDIFRIPRAYAIEVHSVDLVSETENHLRENGYTIKWTLAHSTGPHCSVVYATQ